MAVYAQSREETRGHRPVCTPFFFGCAVCAVKNNLGEQAPSQLGEKEVQPSEVERTN